MFAIRHGKFHKLLFLVITLVVAFATWHVARAYMLGNLWATESATYKYDSSLPSTFQSGTNFGAQVWTNVLSSSWTWTYNASSTNAVKYVYIDGVGGTYVAQTVKTVVGNYIIGITIKFDNSESWYTGSGTPGSTQYDLRSSAAHEFGHALGFSGHPPNGSTPCPTPNSNTARATMCSPAVTGTTYKRSLATDDINGVTYAYPSILINGDD